MHNLEFIRHLLLKLLSDPVFQQVFPLIIVLGVPLLVAALSSRRGLPISSFFMVLETLAAALPWNWFDGSSSSLEKKKLRKKQVRTRAEQLALGDLMPQDGDNGDGGYYPGLVNVSGTYCFMDSTLQAMASLCYLQPHIEEIHTKAEALDVPTPVVDALRDLLHTLNTPTSVPRAYRPLDIIKALSAHSPGKHNLFSSREHQDAQELFQLLSECIKNEAAAVDREGHRDRGLGALAFDHSPASREIGKSVFDGLTANRRSCMECGYTEAVMHFAFDNWQLALPGLAGQCRLEDSLDDYTQIEKLTDCICRKCSMLATHKRLVQDAERLTDASKGENETSSKKRRAREARKLATRVKTALDEGRIEEDIKGVKMEKVFSRASTKQAMIARPPRILVLHLNRSVHYGHYASKNTCRVAFPEILDLTPYTTSGQLSTVPYRPISAPPPPLLRSTTPTPATYAAQRTLYRLAAIVCHYGQHSFGHYICYRRKPRPVTAGSRRFAPPKLACLLGCECERCELYGPIRDDEDKPPRPGCGWLRISDDSVREVGIETVLIEGSGVFMLFYERVVMPRPGIYLSSSPRSSEETVRPEGIHANGSCASLTNGNDNGQKVEIVKPAPRAIGPRIVQSVMARSSSTPPDPDFVETADSTSAAKLPQQNGHATHAQDSALTRVKVNVVRHDPPVAAAPQTNGVALANATSYPP